MRPDPAEVGRARRWARLRLSGCGIALDDPAAEVVVLLVSELVTNAVVHARCPAVLRLSFPLAGTVTASASGSTRMTVPLRVEVCDGSDAAPARGRAPLDQTNGRGLDLVDVLADRWGWQPDGRGKRVWCEIDRETEALPAAAVPGEPAAPAAAALAG